MTKDEAITAMRNGEKVAHKHFSDEEWMKEEGSLYEFEDGCRCEPRLFWEDREDYSWGAGWRIWA